MELRGQQDKVFGMPTTFGFNPPNRDINSSSSSKLSTIHNTTIFDNPPPHQTLDPHQHLNNLPPHNSTRDLDHQQNPDPNSSSSSPFVLTPNATATSAPNISSGSNFKAAPPPAPPQPSATSSRYRECLRNHAASSGGHVLDGCGEFMPSGDEDSPEGLKCAACECHRNFHRKEIDGGGDLVASSNYYVVNHQKHSSRRGVPLVPPPPPFGRHHSSGAGKPVPPMMMTFGGGGGGAAESSSEDLNNMSNLYRAAVGQQAGASKKRFRTKFSQEQKEKMAAVAEKMGWRIQKHDEQDVQRLCAEVGIKRKVFKVWMHNNKQAMKKKEM